VVEKYRFLMKILVVLTALRSPLLESSSGDLQEAPRATPLCCLPNKQTPYHKKIVHLDLSSNVYIYRLFYSRVVSTVVSNFYPTRSKNHARKSPIVEHVEKLTLIQSAFHRGARCLCANSVSYE